ncbi:MAG: hypothetical protein K6F51_00220 [Acetatifactor sp.]|nr:hypothetical protein [Acetatifactor sp.]
MGKIVIMKEVHQPAKEVELDVEDGFMEEVMAPLMAFEGDVSFISLNRMDTMYLVVNGMSGFGLEENFLYVENDGVQKDGLIPMVKPARGTAYFVRVTWVKDGFKKRAKLADVTEDDLIYVRNFMTDVYQDKLRNTQFPSMFG